MALEKIGLGGFLSFDNRQAVRGMDGAGKASNRLTSSLSNIGVKARSVGSAVNQAAGSMRNMGLAALPATAALGFGTKQAVDFEKQMSAVRAITGATAEDMALLEREAKKQGATTAFSATEAAQGMEFLSRAGFDVTQQIAALGPTLNAAAADGIDLATSANIVANTLKGLALPAEDASRVADVLALTSSKANTDMIGLGEAMKFAAPQAKTLGVELETTSAILGAVADAGLKGTIGGTSLTQALVKLTKPTSEGAKLLEDFNVTMTKTASGGLDVVDVFKQINAGLKEETDVVEKARIQTEIFGIRGQKAFAAAATAIDTGKLDTLIAQLGEAEGAAQRMADIRLDNAAGAFTLLRSAAEGFALETAGLFVGPLTEGTEGFTTQLSKAVLVLQELNSETGLTEETADGAGSTIVAVATGIKEGIDLVIVVWRTLRTAIVDTIAEFTGGSAPEMIQQFAKIATVIAVVGAVLAPVFLAIGGIAFFITSVLVPAFGAIGTIAGAVFGGSVLPILGAVGAVFLLLRRDGESIGETFVRVGDMIMGAANFILENAIVPLVDGFQIFPNIFDQVSARFFEFISVMQMEFQRFIALIAQTAEFLTPVFRVVFGAIGVMLNVVANIAGVVFTGVLGIVGSIAVGVVETIITVVETVINVIKGAAELAGKLASFAGLDIGRDLQDFGAGTFKVEIDRGDTSLGGGGPLASIPDEGADLVADLSQISSQPRDQSLLSDGDISKIAKSVGGAVAANVPNKVNVEAKLCVDGKTMAKATAKHKQELNERAGFQATPWQRRAAVEQGAAPVGGVS